ncbi:MAG: APC family permease [Actinobacteria bacterium]|nr:APC family permease [Actinomycetota bacterium]
MSSVGGPLALGALNVPQALGDLRSSSGLIVLIGIAAFAFPVVVWRRYSQEIASSGGLFSFVEAAAGTKVARVQGIIWTLSYFLYLPATVAFVVYELLPAAFPRIIRAGPWLEVGIPLALVLASGAWRRGTLAAVAVVGVAQVVILGFLVAAPATHSLPSVNSFAAHASAPTLLLRSGAVSLFFICGSLPLFLGGEVANARALIRRALPLSVAVGGVCVLAAAVALARVPAGLQSGPFPGWSAAYAIGGHALAVAVAVGTAVSILSLVLLEFVALTRLLPTMFAIRPQTAHVGVASAFVIGAAVLLVDPVRLYDLALPPMLLALFVSQGIVFAAFPWFRRRLGRIRVSDVTVAVGATALMLVGLYTTLRSGLGT